MKTVSYECTKNGTVVRTKSYAEMSEMRDSGFKCVTVLTEVKPPHPRKDYR